MTTIFTCPMHPEIRLEHPGACPNCGMSLERLVPLVDQEDDTEYSDLRMRFLWTMPLTAIKSLLRLSPKTARREKAGGIQEDVMLENVQVGDRLRIRPGENIPADGVVEDGTGSVNESTLTGELLPILQRSWYTYRSRGFLSNLRMVAIADARGACDESQFSVCHLECSAIARKRTAVGSFA